MFKNMLKRAWLSTIRKPGKSILIGLVLFAMANLVLAAISINRAVDESTAFAKSSLGGEVRLSPDMDKIHQEMQNQISQGSSNPQDMISAMTRPQVSRSMADKIAKSDYVRDYTYSISAFADSFNSDALTPTENTNSQMGRGGGGMMLNVNGQQASLSGDFSIQGVNAYAFIPAVKNNELELGSGTYFDETSENAALISYDLAILNDLSVGDTLQFKNVYDESEVTLSVIGIYDSTNDQQNPNAIFTNIDTAVRFLDPATTDISDLGVNSVVYYMENAEYAADFIAEVNAKFPDLAAQNLTIDVDTSAYDQMVGPITSVGSFATVIFWVVIIATIIIVALIVAINVRERRYEMGVLLSLGAKKLNIIGQVFVELVLVGTVFFGLSILTAGILAGSMGESLLSAQIDSANTQAEQNFGRPGTAVGGGGGYRRQNMGGNLMAGPQSISNIDPIDELDISASASDYLLLFATGYLIILLALVVPSVNILRYQPKQILSGKE
jgi:putative ABC transport system permease protein